MILLPWPSWKIVLSELTPRYISWTWVSNTLPLYSPRISRPCLLWVKTDHYILHSSKTCQQCHFQENKYEEHLSFHMSHLLWDQREVLLPLLDLKRSLASHHILQLSRPKMSFKHKARSLHGPSWPKPFKNTYCAVSSVKQITSRASASNHFKYQSNETSNFLLMLAPPPPIGWLTPTRLLRSSHSRPWGIHQLWTNQ